MLHRHPNFALLEPMPGYNTHFIVDFGEETIGYIEFTIDAPQGTIIDVQCFEKVAPWGIQWMHHNGFRYECREGRQTFTSNIRRGFRYVSITVRGFKRPIHWYNLQCRRASYPVQEIGGFECSNWQLNQAYRMSLNTASLCMLDTYVDCPGHEQTFWVGDARITALVNLLNFGAYDLDQRSIRLVGQSLSPDWVKEYYPQDKRYLEDRFLTMAAFPNYPEGGLPMWSFLWVMQCWDHYMHGGNRDDLKENFGYINEMIRHCKLMTNERGLLDIPGAWNLIEWAANDLSPYGEVTANNVLLVKCIRLASDMAKELGRDDEAQAFIADAQRRQTAINQYCWDPDRNAYIDTVRDEWAYKRYIKLCQSKGWTSVSWELYKSYTRVSEHSNTLALICGCVPTDRQDAVKQIVSRIMQCRFVPSAPFGRSPGKPNEKEAPQGIVPIGSPFFLFFSLEALFQMDDGRAAIELMHRVWGDMAATGRRTCPEGFGGSRSEAHAWGAAPAAYLPTRVLGIRPLEPGYRTFVIDPIFGDLKWARGAVATPFGPIRVSWQRNDKNELQITCCAPLDCRREMLAVSGINK